jgi:ferredoxin-NADP reductase
VGRLSGKTDFMAVLADRRWLAPGILEFRLRRPNGFKFIPGQFLRFIMDGYQREYTMVSRPEAQTLVFCIAVVDGGRFSASIQHARIGSVFQVSGPLGHFIFQGTATPAVFVATGIGISSFAAFCRGGAACAVLLHGVRHPDGLIYRDVLQSSVKSYVACIGTPSTTTGDGIEVFPGHVTGYLNSELAPGAYDFYLCGRRDMIRDATAIIDGRFGDSRLFIENYD